MWYFGCEQNVFVLNRFASVELKFLQVQSIMRIKEEEMYIIHWAIDFDHGFDGAADFF